MLFQPLALEALALRQVIQERGIMNLPSGLVPRMRQELEDLARIPGVYEIVEIQINIQKEDEEEEGQAYRNNLKLGDRIKVSCPTGLDWTMEIAGLPSKKLSLHHERKNAFVEDGNLKCKWWHNLDMGGGNKAFCCNSLESFHLDPRGGLLWTNRLQTRYETLMVNVWTKRIDIEETTRFRLFQVLLYTLTYFMDAINLTGLF